FGERSLGEVTAPEGLFALKPALARPVAIPAGGNESVLASSVNLSSVSGRFMKGLFCLMDQVLRNSKRSTFMRANNLLTIIASPFRPYPHGNRSNGAISSDLT